MIPPSPGNASKIDVAEVAPVVSVFVTLDRIPAGYFLRGLPPKT